MKNIKNRCKFFQLVRDIPYQLGNKGKDASCRSKAKILGELLSRIGLKCKIATCEFFWRDLNLPQDILEKASKKFSCHFFLKVFIPENKEWVNVDPTWDIGLSDKYQIGNWDGLSSTKLAVIPRSSIQILLNEKSEAITPDNLTFRDFNPKDNFTQSLNKWFINCRK